MKRTLLTAFSLLAAATLGFTPTPSSAAEKAATAEKKAEKAEIKDATGKEPMAAKADATKEAAGKPFPFVGKVTKFDAAGKTFSLNGAKGDRVFMVDDATKISKEGKPATLADLTVGEEVRGSVLKTGETQTAKSVMIGPKASTDPAAKPGSAPVKATPGTGALAPAAADTKTGAGAPGSSTAGPGVKGAPKPGGEAPAGSKKN